jgi:hypothetical protein
MFEFKNVINHVNHGVQLFKIHKVIYLLYIQKHIRDSISNLHFIHKGNYFLQIIITYCMCSTYILVHRHFISVCYVSGTKGIGIKRIAAQPIGLKHIGN